MYQIKSDALTMEFQTIVLNVEIESMLKDEFLPVSDLNTNKAIKLFGLFDKQELMGLVGIESYTNVGLLRSLVVKPEARKTGYGRELVKSLEAWAGNNSIQTLYLLTTSAANFFSSLGYSVTSRDQAPELIKQTSQFAGLCPASATFMSKNLIY